MTISIRRTSRAADSPGRYFDRVSLDPYYMHRRRTGRSTSTWVPAGPLLQHLSTPGNHLRPVELPEQQTRRDIPARARLRAADRFANRIFPVQLLERQTTGAWQSFSPSRPSRIFPVQLLERQPTGAWQSSSPRRPSRNFLLSHRHHVQIAISRCFLSASLRILCSVHSDFR